MSLSHLHPEILGAFVDGELSPLDQSAAEAHINSCHVCSTAALALHHLRSATKSAAFCNVPAPDALARLRSAARPPEAQRTRLVGPGAVLVPLAAALILGTAVLGGWIWVRQSDSLALEVLDQHLSTLSPASQPEILSSDRHTVKPWFEGKLPFSFNLPEANALPADTVLDGADLVFIHGRPTALLLFTIHKHHTSIFVSQASPFATTRYRQRRSGFEFVEAKTAGLEFLAVGDANPTELNALVRALITVQ
jgi:anti-sigma factor RsiW